MTFSMSPLSSSWEEYSEFRRLPRMLFGLPVFCKLRGRDLDKKRLRLPWESVLLMDGLDGGISELVGEFDGEEEKREPGRRFFGTATAGALEGGPLMGVRADTSGWKIVNDFLLLLSGIIV